MSYLGRLAEELPHLPPEEAAKLLAQAALLDRSGALKICWAVWLVVAWVMALLRFYVRICLKKSFGLDDWTMLVAMVSQQRRLPALFLSRTIYPLKSISSLTELF